MDAVIGVSVTPSTVGMVLVEGDSAADFEAVNLDLELFDVAGLDLSRARAARKEIVATSRVRRTWPQTTAEGCGPSV